MTTDELHRQLDEIENDLLEIAGKTTGNARHMALSGVIDVQATRLSLLAPVLRLLGHTTEANQAEQSARISHAQAAKGLSQ